MPELNQALEENIKEDQKIDTRDLLRGVTCIMYIYTEGIGAEEVKMVYDGMDGMYGKFLYGDQIYNGVGKHVYDEKEQAYRRA